LVIPTLAPQAQGFFYARRPDRAIIGAMPSPLAGLKEYSMTASIADLLRIAITIPPRDVEHLLDSLAQLPHPINADLKYEEWRTTVEFPGYRSWLPEVRAMLAGEGFRNARLHYKSALDSDPDGSGQRATVPSDYAPD
jgi:hypothetical protein